MTSQQLNRAIARATGESVSEISRRGFILLCDERQNEDIQISDQDDTPGNQELVWGRHRGADLDR